MIANIYIRREGVKNCCQWFLFSLILLCESALSANFDSLETFEVKDSIELTRVVNFGSAEFEINAADGAGLSSPDGAYLIIHTKRGDIDRDQVVEQLLLFEKSEIERYLATTNAPKPTPKKLAMTSTGTEAGLMRAISWLTNRDVGFISEGNNGLSQAFAVNVETMQVRQLTASPTHVRSFAVAGQTVLYLADAELSEPTVVPAIGRTIFELLDPSFPSWVPLLRLYAQRRSSGQLAAVVDAPMRLYEPFHRLSLSPDGRHAIVFGPAVDAPEYWAHYRVANYAQFGYSRDVRRSDPTSLELMFRTRYRVVDLEKNTVSNLLDAPSGWLSNNSTPIEVFWNTQDQSVIVSNTYLPLDAVNASELEHRQSQPAIAEISLLTGSVSRVTWEPAGKQALTQKGAGSEFTSLAWSPAERSLTVSIRSEDGAKTVRKFFKRANAWRESRQVSTAKLASSSFRIQKRESIDARPKVYVEGTLCKCAKELLDPAPDADRFRFAPVKIVSWIDRNELQWRGGLVLPINYEEGMRYPVVVQTHGFDPEQFLIDGKGETSTAMAAQALASAGIVVLQVDDNEEANQPPEAEASQYAEGYRAGIQKLIDDGLALPERIGLIAFSRTGLPAIRLLADHPNLLAAVDIADASWWGYAIDLLMANAPPETAQLIQRLTGGAPSLQDIGTWMAGNPLYKVPQARAAVRLQANGEMSLLGIWELYALLQREKRAVDLILFPQGSHNLNKPSERLASQQGAVDWFRFWLQDFEYSDLARASQYSRWRSLKNRTRPTLSKYEGRAVLSVAP